MNAQRRFREHPESGMTLVELLIYSMLLVVILTIAGGIMINSLQSQQTVSTVSSAASTGQLVSTSVSQGIRNASAFEAAAPTSLGQVLRSRTVSVTSTGVATWQCQAWFRTSNGDLYTKTACDADPGSDHRDRPDDLDAHRRGGESAAWGVAGLQRLVRSARPRRERRRRRRRTSAHLHHDRVPPAD